MVKKCHPIMEQLGRVPGPEESVSVTMEVAQKSHEMVVLDTHAFAEDHLLDDRAPVPICDFTNNQGLWGCICDDLFGFHRKAQASQWAYERVRGQYVRAGLECAGDKSFHSAEQGEVVGVVFDGQDGKVIPVPKKLWRPLRASVRFLRHESRFAQVHVEGHRALALAFDGLAAALFDPWGNLHLRTRRVARETTASRYCARRAVPLDPDRPLGKGGP